MHEPSSRPFARREPEAGTRKTASVEGKRTGFKVSGFQSFKSGAGLRARHDMKTLKFRNLKLSNLHFLRCVEDWLTMCNAVVIIKQFRELSLACLCTAVLLNAQPAQTRGSGKILAEL
jgi:hypothetical protein